MKASDSAAQGSAPRWLLWILGIWQTALCVWAGILLAFWPPWFRVYYPVLDAAPYREDALEITRWVSGIDAPAELGPRLRHGILTPKELRHYEDVRAYLKALPAWTAAWLLGWLWIAGRSRLSLPDWRRVQWRAATASLALAATGAALAAWDWKQLFIWIHAPLFGAHSWRFADSTFSLAVFPPAFWKGVGAFLAGLPIAAGGATGLALWFLEKAKRKRLAPGQGNHRPAEPD